ncbi:MAG: PAS domain-containing protein [Coxiellaceae bacterium]|nr:PAS domain-containing protein [Coxiellaceae bacterium]
MSDKENRPYSQFGSNFVLELLKYLPVHVFWKYYDGVYMGCNYTFANALGFSSPEDIIGKTDYDLPVDKHDSDLYREDDLEVMRSKKPKLNIEEQQTLSNGRKIFLLTNKVPLFDDDNNVCGVLGVYSDITELKNAQLALLAAKEEAEISNKMKSDFIQNMEHDIRTPFSGLYGLSKSLWENETDANKKESLGFIVQSAEELLRYCNDILDFDRIESGAWPIIEKKFSIHEVIKKIIAIELPAAKDKKLELQLDIDKEMPEIVIGDSKRIYRILLNLISNAIKFTDKGAIQVSVKPIEKQGKVLVVRMIVSDSGIGIPEEVRQLIFERFSRVGLANQGAYKGLGLGLKAVKRFVSELDGEVDVISEAGKGSDFICTIPFKLPLVQELLDSDS